MTKLALLLAVLAAGNSAWAQAQVLTVPPGVPYTFSSTAVAGGDGIITYQWYRDGVAIAGATDSVYTLPAELAYGIGVEFKRGAVSSTCPHSVGYANAFIITFCGLLLKDVCWAYTNVTQPRTFAPKPDMYTELYQWNRLTAYSAADPLTPAWNSPDNTSIWVINPCPAGWRLPTVEEYQALHAAGTSWAAAYAKGNDVAGRFYGPSHASCSFIAGGSMAGCIFMPAGGNRSDSNGSLNNQGNYGDYWSSSQVNTNNGYHLYFSFSESLATGNNPKGYGFTIRCVQ